MRGLKETLKNVLNLKQSWPFFVILVIAFALGYISHGGGKAEHSDHSHEEAALKGETKAEVWTCSMHPQIRQPKAGACPICGMDLIPVSDDGGEELGVRQLKLSENAMKLADIQTEPVARKYIESQIRMVGKIAYDETRVKTITTWIAGRIDRLFVDYTGIPVRKGDHLASLYSPQLITAQKELMEAKKLSKYTLESVREKLRLWGLTESQIKEIEGSNKIKDHLTIYSPMEGVVVEKMVKEGVYVKTGTRLYTIADLSHLWVKLDAYESDLPWIRYGQTVNFETEAYPGEIFKGQIAFIDPVLNQKTRTVKVRINIPNKDGRLKPEMFVRAVLHSKLTAKGQVMDEDLMGKWISPMHPEIVKDRPGKCDRCGMALVPAHKLGYVKGSDSDVEGPLVIPVTAPLVTGARAVVYLAVPDKKGVFEGREIRLGPRAGDFYIVKEGLKEGDRVVTQGAFKIDSDLQIRAKPSMMNPEGGVAVTGHHHHHDEKSSKAEPEKPSQDSSVYPNTPQAFKDAIQHLTHSYLKIQQSLAADEDAHLKHLGEELRQALGKVDMSLLKGQSHMAWMKIEGELKKGIEGFLKSKSISEARTWFDPISNQMISLLTQFPYKPKETVYKVHCPMALDNKGAFWLQNSEDVKNPYYGASMLMCHDSKEKILKKE